MITTAIADKSKLTQAEVERLYAIMLHAYAVTEVEVWGEDYTRMDLDEFLGLMDKGQLIVAYMNEEVVGSIATYPTSDDAYAFGLLSADFSKKGNGIGGTLIEAAEAIARKNGAKYMELEILRPKDLKVAFKERLREWYSKLGYRLGETCLFEELKPEKAEKAKNFIRPCVFDCYRKALK